VNTFTQLPHRVSVCIPITALLCIVKASCATTAAMPDAMIKNAKILRFLTGFSSSFKTAQYKKSSDKRAHSPSIIMCVLAVKNTSSAYKNGFFL